MLRTSGFVDDVILSYHKANGPELSTTLRLEEVRQVAVPVGCQTTTVFDQVHQSAARGRSLLSTIALLYPPSERSETGGYIVFLAFPSVCAHSYYLHANISKTV